MATKTKTDKRKMGAIPNPPDHRDIPAASFQPTVELQQDRETDISKVPVQDQKNNGSCVGQAEGSLVEYFWIKETGKPSGVSRRFIYGRAKALDGYNGEGTYPRIAAKVTVDEGAATELTVPNDNSLVHDKYITFNYDDAVKKDSILRKTKGFADVTPLTAFNIRQALAINEVMTVSLQVGDWNGEFVKPTYENGSNRGWHRVMLYADKVLANGDIQFKFRNSWGLKWGKSTDGNGKFLWSDYENYMMDGLVYTDIPNELLEEAHDKPFQFTKDLKKGMTNNDVAELQKRLSELAFFDSSEGFTKYFGTKTEAAVQKYQEAFKIAKKGDAGYGIVGPKTRQNLNEKAQLPPTFELKPRVKRMAEALMELAVIVGTPIKITDAYRSNAEQTILYQKGRDKNEKVIDPSQVVTNAKAGYSFHNHRVAFDIVFLKPNGDATYTGDWNKIGRVGELIGLEWGGRWATFTDKPHFQLTGGYSIEDFIENKIDESRFA